MYATAIYVEGRIVTGRHHGEAYGLLSEQERRSEGLLSGFYDEATGKFFCDEQTFYTKSLYLVRHSYPSCGYHENDDPDLCKEGIAQAHRVGHFLRDQRLDDYVGYTSPYLRCLITADIVSRTTGMRFIVDPALAEAVTDDTIVENHASDFPQFTWPTSVEFRIEKESPQTFSDRLKSVAEKVAAHSVVVTHLSPIAGLARLVSGSGDVTNKLPMGSVTHIDNNQIVHFGKQV